MTVHRLIAVGVALLCASSAAQVAAQDEGSVQIPLSIYETLTGGGGRRPDAPGRYAFGAADVSVDVSEENGHATATVTATVTVRTLTEEWTLVPLLPAGTALASVSIDGVEQQLVATPAGLAWATETRGSSRITLVYTVDATRFGNGSVLGLPVPPATTTRLTAALPGTGLRVSVVPGSAVHTEESDGGTTVSATVAGTTAVQISWDSPSAAERATVSRAVYRGELANGAVSFIADYIVELSGDGSETVPLLPSHVALRGLSLDGVEAPIYAVDGHFAVAVRGRGRHLVQASFEVPVAEDEGLPGISLSIPEVPVSRFELTLPGEKDVTVEPQAAVRRTSGRGQTLATFHVAMTDTVSLHWPEAVPEEPVEVETRANANLTHIAHAEEGVLHVRAIALFEVTHGRTSQFELTLPPDVQVNGVQADSGAVADWRITGDRERVLTVYLDREVTGELSFEVSYEKGLEVTDGASPPFEVPLLIARGVNRQRGMVALLSSRDLTLLPREEEHLTRVGENQLPPAVRDSIELTVAHTFRYVETTPRLVAATAVREREAARFDAQVDTLVSLGDVTTTGSATVEVEVKSGGLTELLLTLPPGVNFLDLTAPSLREHRIEEARDAQRIRIEFTQEMQGRFRVEVRYERIRADGEQEAEEEQLTVPILHVEAADVEHGRVAVEALAAVQVDAGTVERLSPVEVSELPQQLVLRTSNPILLAYRYAHAAPPPVLELRITRHREIATHDATIDEAVYRTLYTTDGLAVTTALFTVRNQRKQFLRVELPAGSEVWSARVNGQPETPALAAGADEDAPAVLINIIHSTDGFPVELIYATRVPSLGTFGRVNGELPRPDMTVTRSTWEVFLPPGPSYAEPASDMTLVDGGSLVGRAAMNMDAAVTDGLQIRVPAEGVRFTFEKLYAGEGGETAGFAIPYASSFGSALATGLSIIGTLLLWLGFIGLLLLRFRGLLLTALPEGGAELATYRLTAWAANPAATVSRGAVIGLGGLVLGGTVLLGATLWWLSTSAAWPIGISAVLGAGAGALWLRPRIAAWWSARRERRAEALPPAAPPPAAPPAE